MAGHTSTPVQESAAVGSEVLSRLKFCAEIGHVTTMEFPWPLRACRIGGSVAGQVTSATE